MTSLDDVARAAGVSTTTASRALNGRGRVSEATRSRVRGAAEALGYVASAAASSLASGRAENIGVIVPLMDRWFFATVLDGVAGRLARHGYDLTLYNLTDDAEQRRRLFEVSLRRGRVDALIVLSTPLSDADIADLRATGLPLRGVGVPRSEFPVLRVDDTEVGRTAAAHLIELGHRSLAQIGQTLGPETAADPTLDIPMRRRRGFDDAVAEAGIDAARYAEADFTVEGGQRAARELLSQPNPPTAIFAASDEMAYGVLSAARELGLSIPRDLSVIGVDGHSLAGLFDLTTIDQFPHAQGERAADAVLADLGVMEPEITASAPLPFRLIPRASTGPRSLEA